MTSSSKADRTRPAHWPCHVRYLTATQYHSSVSSDIRSHIRAGPSTVRTSKPAFDRPVQCLVGIRPISDPRHPANGQYGLFAAKKIPPRSHIIDYLGEIHCDDRPDSDYDLSLYRTQEGKGVGVDASQMGNEARFINDYRGVKAKPNAVFEERRTEAGELRMSVWSASQVIRKGDEIVVSYGKMWWRARTSELSQVNSSYSSLDR